MKTKARLLLLVTATLLLSQCDDDKKSKDCDKNTSFIKSVTNTHGIVRFSTILDAYIIVTTIPGTYDSQDIGVVCNLQKDFQQNELEVTFDGSYYQYTGGPVPELGGQTYYYLGTRQDHPEIKGAQNSSCSFVSPSCPLCSGFIS